MGFPTPSPDPIFNAPDADIVLRSDDPQPIDFRVHKCILLLGSPFFQAMFPLPQSKATTNELVPVLNVAEPSAVFDPLLRFLYPVPDPEVSTLDELVPLLCAAVKYNMAAVTHRLRALLVSPTFLESAPLRVFATASRLDLEEEAKVASKHTLRVRVLDVPLCDDLRHISAYSYHQLLQLHLRRGEAARQALCMPKDLCCIQCNGSNFNAGAHPKWWDKFVVSAEEELRSRPTTEVIFSLKFLMQCAHASGCPRCSGSIIESFIFLDALKEKIDALPCTI